MATKEARKVLPDTYTRPTPYTTSAAPHSSWPPSAEGRLDLLDAATDDLIHQHQRSALFPPLFDIFAAAKGAGAHAAWLSGAGSSVAALCPEDRAREAANAMLTALQAAGMTGRSLVTRIAPQGAEVRRSPSSTDWSVSEPGRSQPYPSSATTRSRIACATSYLLCSGSSSTRPSAWKKRDLVRLRAEAAARRASRRSRR